MDARTQPTHNHTDSQQQTRQLLTCFANYETVSCHRTLPSFTAAPRVLSHFAYQISNRTYTFQLLAIERLFTSRHFSASASYDPSTADLLLGTIIHTQHPRNLREEKTLRSRLCYVGEADDNFRRAFLIKGIMIETPSF